MLKYIVIRFCYPNVTSDTTKFSMQKKKSIELSCLRVCAPVLNSYQIYKASGMLLWIKYKKALLHSAERVTNRKWEAANTTKPHRGKWRHSFPMILCKWSFEFSIQLCHWHSLLKVCHKNFYRQCNAPMDGDKRHAVLSSTGRLVTPPPNTSTSVWQQLRVVNTMSLPRS